MRIVALTLLALLLGVIGGHLLARLELGHTGQPEQGKPNPPVAKARSRPSAIRQTVRQRELHPSDRRYEPLALMKEENGVIRPVEIFEAEPRDSVHAPIFEKRIKTQLARVLKELGLEDRVQVDEVECRTLSCRTTLKTNPEDTVSTYDLLNGIMLGDSQSPDYDQAAGRITLMNLYRSDARDDAYYSRFLVEALEPALQVAKESTMAAER